MAGHYQMGHSIARITNKNRKNLKTFYINNIVIIIWHQQPSTHTYVLYCTTTLQVDNFQLQLFNELLLEVLPTVLVFF